MGGTLFSTERLPLSNFLTLKDEVLTTLRNAGIQADVPLWYRSKKDFGDLDIVVRYTPYIPKFLEEQGWNTGQNNGPCYSFSYKNFQVDLIYTSKKNYKSTLDFLSYNDLGNLIGKLAASVGLRYGSTGLFYRFYEGTGNNKYQLKLTDDMKIVCNLLFLDYKTYDQGFDTMEDIYKFIASSRVFHISPFNLANLNNTTRTRDRKRKNVVGFYEWCLLEGKDKDLRTDPKFYYTLSSLSDLFPSFANEYLSIIDQVKFTEVCKKKFNGSIVMELTDLEGKELGKFIKHMKQVFTDIVEDPKSNEWNSHTDTWKDYVYFTPRYHIKDQIKQEFINTDYESNN